VNNVSCYGRVVIAVLVDSGFAQLLSELLKPLRMFLDEVQHTSDRVVRRLVGSVEESDKVIEDLIWCKPFVID